MSKWDAIVVGAGAGGGIAAYVLAKAGKRVLLIERGKWLSYASEPRDHLRNHRLSRYGHNTGPEIEGNPRVHIDQAGRRRVVSPIQGEYNNIASCVGSGTYVYGGQAWRFHPLDFKMASTYGVPEGSSLVDWPISYDDLAPYYELVEWELGVAGGKPPPQMPSRRDYPMPAHKATRKGSILREAAGSLGWDYQDVPLLINSVERDGRSACVNCQHCVGFACPVDARNGTQNTVIPKAMATGNCEVWAESFVHRLTHREGGWITGVHVDRGELGQSLEEADVVVLACGAIETARLLLNSATRWEQAGVGNAYDQVGRNLQGHYYAHAQGSHPEAIWDGIGPGATTATLSFNHGNDGIVGGGMLADDFVMMPIAFAKGWKPDRIPNWGQGHKDWMREGYRRSFIVTGPVHEIPSADARVEIDRDVRDKQGLPVAKLSGATHPETLKVTEFMQARARDWLRAAGAEFVESRSPSLYLSAGQHQAGTCRMGDDRFRSVVDSSCKVWSHDNVFIADGSVHPTNGGFNPVLSIMANAWRTADLIVASW